MARFLLACASEEEFHSIATYVVGTVMCDSRIGSVSVKDNEIRFLVRARGAGLPEPLSFRLVRYGVTFFNAAKIREDLYHGVLPDCVISVGACAGLQGQPVGTVERIERFVCADLDLTAFGYEMGQYTKGGHFNMTIPYAVSGSSFISGIQGSDDRDRILRKFPQARCYDMENFMIAGICKERGVPFFSVKGVPDCGMLAYYEEGVSLASVNSLIAAIDEAIKFYRHIVNGNSK